jgi:hypothetical protein
MFIYKIRNKRTGLFSSGGSYPRWTKKGKVWRQLSHVRQHLDHVERGLYRRRLYIDDPSEIVEYAIVEHSTISLEGYYGRGKETDNNG